MALHARLSLSPTVNSRMVLMAGFGGLLLLTALAGADGIKALEDIERSSDRIRDDFQLRTRVLERIRTDLYRSGTDVRDYLLEPEPGKAEGHRYTLLETRRDMDDALERYRNLLSSSEVQPFAVLTKELAEYWGVLEPTFVWNASERQRAGYPFLRDEVFPRRSSILAIASQIGGLNEAQRKEIVGTWLERIGLTGFASHYPKQLSGGMQQRTAIARALANDPAILLLDEPFGALDNQTRALMQELLLGIWERERKTVLFVTHDIEEAIFLATRVLVMSARPGRIKADVPIALPYPRHYPVKTSPEFSATPT